MKTIFNGNSTLKAFLIIAFLTINIVLPVAQTENAVISVIKKEVDKNYAELQSDESPSPFFISYAIIDQHQIIVKASSGTVTQSDENRTGWGIPDLYVGSYLVNNEKMDAYTHSSATQKVNLDNNFTGIDISIRDALNNRYKAAVEAYEKKKNMLSYMKQTAEEEALPDFEKTPVVNLILPPEKVNIDRKYWETYACTASIIAKKYPEILKSDVTVSILNGMVYYYNTEGSQYAVPVVQCSINFVAQLTTDDGKKLQEHISISRSSTDRLPDMDTFTAECEKKIMHLLALKKAPVVDQSYVGPVLCEKESLVNLIGFSFFNNGMMVHHRDLDSNASVRLKRFDTEMGKRIISNQLTVKSLSGKKTYKGEVLDGYIPVDSEGVIPAEELVLIENGILKNMLNERIPSLKNPHSNGHKRFMLSSAFSENPVFTRPSAYVFPGVIHFTAKKTNTDADLKQKLIEAARKAGLEYAYIMKWSSNNGGIRVYVEDGREELVRGLYNPKGDYKAFGKVLGISDEEYISTNWSRGAVSSYIIPKSMLFEELEIPKIK